ncbi:protein of unknown function [Candidatus Nitrosotalea okcheonensis]|uniref:Uncharacterized protein n=1 Tax=Candidatus Nitrosotalea okcheonensis TaxID=1903276 RepID=A0A2H1FEP2_9ARCH|nr:protein of unknown function [Candidatus Nitrosotalea okcheonensis]
MSSGKSDMTVLGSNDNGMTAGISRNEQIHTGIFG